MATFPIMLKLEGRRTVVVGGGPVALRKARALRDAGAAVTVVAKELCESADTDGLTVILGPYEPETLAGAMLVFAATNDPGVNAAVADAARATGALVNSVDQPDACDFYSAAVVTDGAVTVAIGTDGTAPALASQLKNPLRRALPERIGEFAEALHSLRGTVKARVSDGHRRHDVFTQLAGPDGYDTFRHGGTSALIHMLETLLSESH